MSMETAAAASAYMTDRLARRYGAREASAITRIVFEDVFQVRGDAGHRLFSEAEQQRFSGILQRLLAGEPVQYVLGEADFFGLKFTVDPSVLIPRQETEELVAWALGLLKNYPEKNPRVLDIGLGSGCIGITLKKKFPNLLLSGVEKSPAAVETAIRNADRILGPAQAEFTLFDILERTKWAQFSQFDLIISNPPYIPVSEKKLVPEHVFNHEPETALFVQDEDPLLFYRVIADFSLIHLQPGAALLFECNEFNAGNVAALLEEKGLLNVELRKDLAGADRMVGARKKTN